MFYARLVIGVSFEMTSLYCIMFVLPQIWQGNVRCVGDVARLSVWYVPYECQEQ